MFTNFATDYDDDYDNDDYDEEDEDGDNDDDDDNDDGIDGDNNDNDNNDNDNYDDNDNGDYGYGSSSHCDRFEPAGVQLCTYSSPFTAGSYDGNQDTHENQETQENEEIGNSGLVAYNALDAPFDGFYDGFFGGFVAEEEQNEVLEDRDEVVEGHEGDENVDADYDPEEADSFSAQRGLSFSSEVTDTSDPDPTLHAYFIRKLQYDESDEESGD